MKEREDYPHLNPYAIFQEMKAEKMVLYAHVVLQQAAVDKQ